MIMKEISKEERRIIFNQDTTGGGGKVWDLAKDAVYGRYMVASKNIEAGEAIFSEDPLVWGPSVYNPVLVCVGCLRYLSVDSGCVECGWPLCGAQCPFLPLHRGAECKYLQNNRRDLLNNGEFDLTKIPLHLVLFIRILLLKENNKEVWDRIHVLDPQLGDWLQHPAWLEEGRKSLKVLRDLLGQELEEQEVLTVIGICSTNAFSKYLEPEICGSDRLVGTKGRVIFLLSSMMSHSCSPNSEQCITSQKAGLQLTLRATRRIQKGEQIQISYTDLMEPTILRQINLLENKLFACSCSRCVDPRELGANCGTLKCFSCLKKGTQPPGELVATSKELSWWECTRCSARSSSSKVQGLVAKIAEEQEALLTNTYATLTDFEKYLTKYSKLLHPWNGLLIKVKYQLCGMYGRFQGYALTELDAAGLKRKRDLCEEVLKVLDIIQPCATCRRGMILYELHAVLMIQGRDTLDKDPGKAAQDLRWSLDLLKESLNILQFEPEGTLAHTVYQGGKASLPCIQQFVETLKS